MQIMRSALLFVLCASVSLAAAQSLDDVAKTKPTRKAARLITNEDLPPAPPEEEAAAPVSSATAETAELQDSTAGSPSDSDPKDLPSLEKKQAELKAGISFGKKHIDQYREKMKAESDDHRRDIQQEVLDEMASDLKDLQQQSDALQKQIDELRPAAKDDVTKRDKDTPAPEDQKPGA